jgi:hypothetical protein
MRQNTTPRCRNRATIAAPDSVHNAKGLPSLSDGPARFGWFDCVSDLPRQSVQVARNWMNLEMRTLKRLLLATTLAAGFAMARESSVALAQQPAKHHASTTSGWAQLRDQIARMTSLSPKEVEVHATNAMIRVVLVNTAYNGDRPSDREHLASTISALVNKNAEKELDTNRSSCSTLSLLGGDICSRRQSTRSNSVDRRTEHLPAIRRSPDSTKRARNPASRGECWTDPSTRRVSEPTLL